MPLITCISLAIGLTAMIAAETPSLPAVPLQGPPFSARITAMDPQWNITFDTASERRVIGGDDLIHWGACPDYHAQPRIGPIIVLNDGGLLCAKDILRLDSENVAAYCRDWGEVSIRLSALRGIVFRPPPDTLECDRLFDLMFTDEGSQDRLLLDDDQLSGAVSPSMASSNPKDAEPLEAIRFRMKDREVELPIDRVIALKTNPALTRRRMTDRPHGLLGFQDGSCLTVTKVTPRAESVQLDLVCGARLKADSATVFGALRMLRPIHQGVTYLSKIDPLLYKHIPFLRLQQPYGLDRTTDGGRLRAGGHVHTLGIGMPSISRMVFPLDGAYRRFQAELAIDDRDPSSGSVVFQVYLKTAQGEFQNAFTSQTVRHGDKTVPLNIDIADATHLLLIVTDAEDGGVGEQANWLSARLLP